PPVPRRRPCARAGHLASPSDKTHRSLHRVNPVQSTCCVRPPWGTFIARGAGGDHDVRTGVPGAGRVGGREAMRRLWVVAVLGLAVSSTASAAEYRDARVRHVEEGVSIQRANETGSEEATANLPFLPGDRVWTDGGGRVEFQFARGSLVRLDRASKLDYAAREDRDRRVVLRLWSGAVFVHSDPRDDDLEFE